MSHQYPWWPKPGLHPKGHLSPARAGQIAGLQPHLCLPLSTGSVASALGTLSPHSCLWLPLPSLSVALGLPWTWEIPACHLLMQLPYSSCVFYPDVPTLALSATCCGSPLSSLSMPHYVPREGGPLPAPTPVYCTYPPFFEPFHHLQAMLGASK
jgi:hypothetical protein